MRTLQDAWAENANHSNGGGCGEVFNCGISFGLGWRRAGETVHWFLWPIAQEMRVLQQRGKVLTQELTESEISGSDQSTLRYTRHTRSSCILFLSTARVKMRQGSARTFFLRERLHGGFSLFLGGDGMARFGLTRYRYLANSTLYVAFRRSALSLHMPTWSAHASVHLKAGRLWVVDGFTGGGALGGGGLCCRGVGKTWGLDICGGLKQMPI